jgi:hypothetical protein
MCHRASESTAWQCGCGYEFGQDIDTVQRLLRDQLRNAWIQLGALITIDLGILAITIITALTGAGLIPGLGFAFLLAATGRTIRKIAISRESLRQLAPRELPTARLLT